MNHLSKIYTLLFLILPVYLSAESETAYTKIINVETTRKTSKNWKKRETTVITDNIKEAFKEDEVNKYGGWLKEKKKATGFFRVEKDKKGRWWFIDPEGHPQINISVNSVTANKSKKSLELLEDKFGSKQKWADETIKLLLENSFNSFGNSVGWTFSTSINKNWCLIF